MNFRTDTDVTLLLFQEFKILRKEYKKVLTKMSRMNVIFICTEAELPKVKEQWKRHRQLEKELAVIKRKIKSLRKEYKRLGTNIPIPKKLNDFAI